ncbi:RNA pseudouridylate synthase domain-containing protein 1-like [Epargyreus clarus]|uniref:RNA pseudouridylate synthase domain-containing protein 1-like n=1 Tax=Epargyreus clarus TaxID=520877 RepID=UPI003C2CA0F8
MAVEILYESDSFIIVNKPYDMYINSDDKDEKNTVAYHIGHHDSHRSTSSHPLHFVQRLDYSTSGVLCIAKTKTAAAKAGKLFEKRATRKYYLGILRGSVPFDIADVRYDIGSDETPENTHKMVAVTSATSVCGRPRAAHTRILVLDTGYYNDEPVTLVMMKPITGRRHQLRVHCHAIGHTILGDYTYSDRTDTAPSRMYLHAARLVLPLQEEPLDIAAPEPFSDVLLSGKWQGQRFTFEEACNTLDTSPTSIQYTLQT